DVVGADVVGAGLVKALSAVAALQQEPLTHGNPTKGFLEVARFAREHQGRKSRKLPLDRLQRRVVRILRQLNDRLLAPGIMRPTLGHDRLPLQLASQTARFCKAYISDRRSRRPETIALTRLLSRWACARCYSAASRP